VTLTPLSDDDIAVLRSATYIRDFYDPGPPSVALSAYNIARKDVFINDDDLNITAELALRTWSAQLSGVYSTRFHHGTTHGEDSSDADVAAALIQKDAFFALIRAAVLENMMIDPGFRGSIADEKIRDKMFELWKDQISRDRTFAVSRTTSSFRGIPLRVL
jgi:hypothetical protein